MKRWSNTQHPSHPPGSRCTYLHGWWTFNAHTATVAVWGFEIPTLLPLLSVRLSGQIRAIQWRLKDPWYLPKENLSLALCYHIGGPCESNKVKFKKKVDFAEFWVIPSLVVQNSILSYLGIVNILSSWRCLNLLSVCPFMLKPTFI